MNVTSSPDPEATLLNRNCAGVANSKPRLPIPKGEKVCVTVAETAIGDGNEPPGPVTMLSWLGACSTSVPVMLTSTRSSVPSAA